ncbi:MAG: hypothetical protein F4Z85_07970 [Gemmatimonadetes bacterium]|nr:hypothetical protein [Gemmatimonadota bacterium]MYB71289.1 hypothetical protein [Gemmatimonadota bacterium]
MQRYSESECQWNHGPLANKDSEFTESGDAEGGGASGGDIEGRGASGGDTEGGGAGVAKADEMLNTPSN